MRNSLAVAIRTSILVMICSLFLNNQTLLAQQDEMGYEDSYPVDTLYEEQAQEPYGDDGFYEDQNTGQSDTQVEIAREGTNYHVALGKGVVGKNGTDTRVAVSVGGDMRSGIKKFFKGSNFQISINRRKPNR